MRSPLYGFQRCASLEAHVMVALRFRIPDLLIFGDQQTSEGSFCHCLIFME